MTNAEKAPRLLVVALMKSGTHLIQELLLAMGYRIAGVPRIPPASRAQPTRDESYQMLQWTGDLAPDDGGVRIKPSHWSDEQFLQASESSWQRLQTQLQIQLGTPLQRHYGRADAHWDADLGYVPFSISPRGTAWVLSELDLTRVDGGFWKEWYATGEPRIVFVYRDPRATTLSMVNFLADVTGKGYGDYTDFSVFHEVLKSFPNLEEQLSYAVTTPGFPARGDHARMRWLLRHPRVLALPYESLIGPRGGGTTKAQLTAVTQFCEHVSAPGAAADKLADRMYNDEAFTFYQASINEWRSHYSDTTLALANDQYADDLEAYGYDA